MSDQMDNIAVEWFQEATIVVVESDDYFKRFAQAGLSGDLVQGILVLNELDDRVSKLLAQSDHAMGRSLREPLLKIFAHCNLMLCLASIELSKQQDRNPQLKRETLDYARATFVRVRDAPWLNIALLPDDQQRLYAQLERIFGKAT